MTGLEIAVVAGVVGFVVVGIISVTGWLLERARKEHRRRYPFELTDISLRASRPVVLVGQNSDLRFYFTVNNPNGLQLSYDGHVTVQDIPDVASQRNSFSQDYSHTEIDRLHCKWTTVGRKRVTALVTVSSARKTLTGFAEGFVDVVAELPDQDGQ